jgi:hypothetical protein
MKKKRRLISQRVGYVCIFRNISPILVQGLKLDRQDFKRYNYNYYLIISF